jgi:hypothetical protein
VVDDFDVLRDQARAAEARGDVDRALAALLAAASQAHIAERDYLGVLRRLEDVLSTRGNARGALTVVGYAATKDPKAWRRARTLLPRVPPEDRARVEAAQGRPAEAAHSMEQAGRLAAAAVYREQANDWSGARALWSRLAHVTEREEAYIAALVRFDLARCAKQSGDSALAREALVASVRLLEEAADHFESIGQRERAFDCFQMLVQVGREGGAFEDVLEGFVNAIRVLREDHFKYYAIEYFDEAIASAADQGENSAAATLAREAEVYARSQGLASAAAAYGARQAELWLSVAQQTPERGAPVEIAENALQAAILAYGGIGQYARVGALYGELAALDLSPPRRDHYSRAAKRYVGVADEPLAKSNPTPRTQRPDAHFAQVWHVDVLEWEQGGSAAEACSDILLDKRWDNLIRRRAMLARLTALELEAGMQQEQPAPASARARLADQLALLRIYPVLAPLEKLFEGPEQVVKVAVLHAMRALVFKRAFVTVRAGLRDPDPVVVEQAAEALEGWDSPQAFDPLARIVGESPNARVRAAALKALARIDTIEAAEYLLTVLETGLPSDRWAAAAALKASSGSKFIEAARNAVPRSSDALKTILREILAGRGMGK